ncbi:hypothetical protein [Streptomyces sp. NPDC006270]|uniref:hypothetical protein n=1 Tax=Streptomyces sp. NPDC006270 TaxID=3364741 RepID=UPI0036CFD78F
MAARPRPLTTEEMEPLIAKPSAAAGPADYRGPARAVRATAASSDAATAAGPEGPAQPTTEPDDQCAGLSRPDEDAKHLFASAPARRYSVRDSWNR